jgi:transcriptional regulator with XRE-family HTH domain
MSAVSIPSRKMPWQTKAQRGTVLAVLAIKKEIVKARLLQIREDEGHPDKPGKPLTVEDAAARAGVKYRTWQRWEAGESIPYARNLAAIADAFGFDVAEFYDSSGDRAPTPEPFRPANGEDRLARIETALEALRQEREQGIAEVQALLRRIEDAVTREREAKAETEEATKRLLAAADVATQAWRAETRTPAEEPERHAT